MPAIDIIGRAVIIAVLAFMSHATGTAAKLGDVMGIVAYTMFTLAYAGMVIEAGWQFVKLLKHDFCPASPAPDAPSPSRHQRRMRLREYLLAQHTYR